MRTLKSKVILNFSSTVLPMAVGVITIPLLIDGIGVERFGMLSIAWMIVGYFGLLDMGLGRALTQKVAYKIGINDTKNLKATILSALVAVALLGLLGGGAVLGFAKTIVYEMFNISEQYKEESLRGIYWVAFTIPFAILSTGLLGVLEGQHYFGWTSIVRAPLGLFMFIAPLIAIQWSTSLEFVFASLFVVRLLSFFSLVMIAKYTLKGYTGWDINFNELKSLFAYGGWVTVTNMVSPIMVYFDRFYIATVLSVSVVAFYTTPIDFLTKALLVPLALVGVMFASFSAEWHVNREKVIKNYQSSVLAVAAIMLPFVLIIFVFAESAMSLWLGISFAKNSYVIVKIIAVGLFFNALAMVPYALIQAIGRADITAKCHLFELPLFVFLLLFFVNDYGLVGAAFVWSTRVIIDAGLLYFIAYKITKVS